MGCGCNSPEWIVGMHNIGLRNIPRVSGKLSFRDRLGALRMRLGIGRMKYSVPPGLYTIGTPDENSDVFVTANYKLSFDKLRESLDGISAWILVLDTKGINVWCAAGKGTFGTDELTGRILRTGLAKIVMHRKLILPQLGAVGVSAYQVTKAAGFKIAYGPVLARDIPGYIANGYEKTPEMREVKFGFIDRLILTPIELKAALIPLLIGLAVYLTVASLRSGVFKAEFLIGFLPFLGALITGAVLVPVLLPFIPGKAFSLKGSIAGLLWAGASIWIFRPDFWTSLIYFLTIPAISAFLAMNFTGASTFTTLSGVKLEVRIVTPFAAVLCAASLALGILQTVNVI
ncbi:MAG: hypothetical protein A2Y33_01090 [Spirochaetes bacterium GWF1_51_8]|nr:MAG: hypothetical protein A2Y33_01090 [Spirochaetes bacterium GWF1_51_8]